VLEKLGWYEGSGVVAVSPEAHFVRPLVLHVFASGRYLFHISPALCFYGTKRPRSPSVTNVYCQTGPETGWYEADCIRTPHSNRFAGHWSFGIAGTSDRNIILALLFLG
jgi:hypothetical protein